MNIHTDVEARGHCRASASKRTRAWSYAAIACEEAVTLHFHKSSGCKARPITAAIQGRAFPDEALMRPIGVSINQQVRFACWSPRNDRPVPMFPAVGPVDSVAAQQLNINVHQET